MGTLPEHHFYLLESRGDDIVQGHALLKDLGWTIYPSHNVFDFLYESFGIDDARLLRAQALLRGNETKRAFIISLYTITHDAAQALLKILEEAPEGVVFILCVPSLFQVPDTIISRGHVVDSLHEELDIKEYDKIAEIFFTKTVSERFVSIEKLLKGTKDDRPLRNRGLVLLHAIEKYAHMHKRTLPDTFFKNYAFIMQPTSSPKIILESIAGSIQ